MGKRYSKTNCHHPWSWLKSWHLVLWQMIKTIAQEKNSKRSHIGAYQSHFLLLIEFDFWSKETENLIWSSRALDWRPWNLIFWRMAFIPSFKAMSDRQGFTVIYFITSWIYSNSFSFRWLPGACKAYSESFRTVSGTLSKLYRVYWGLWSWVLFKLWHQF